MATNPTAIRMTDDTAENIRVTGGGGGGGATNITQVAGNNVAATPAAALPVELFDGTNPLGTPSNPLTIGGRKSTQTLTTTPLGANATYTSAWFDTTLTGDLYVETTARSDVAGAQGTYLIQGSDDTGNANFTITLAIFSLGNGTGVGANSTSTINANISTRYWRVNYQNGASPQTSFELTATTAETFNPTLFPLGVGATQPLPNIGSQRAPMIINLGGGAQCQVLGVGLGGAFNALTDALANSQTIAGFSASGVVNGNMTVFQMMYNGATWDRVRTPATFRGGQLMSGTAGAQIIWQQVAAKKIRLMRYAIEIPANATLTAAGTITIGFEWGVNHNGSSGLTQLFPSDVSGMHSCWINNAALTTDSTWYQSGWIDLGNGVISSNSNMALYAGIMLPQAVGAVTPTWTLSSSTQWESITIGFKTLGAAGVFRLISTNAAGGTTTVATTQATLAGSLVVLVVRTTNSASGAPVFSVSSNTAGDTYTVTAVTTNATDGANGSSLCVLYTLASKGAASNVVTVSLTNSPTSSQMWYMEYQQASVGLDAALVGATGNSSAPSSGAYTTTVAGDLLITAAASSGNVPAAAAAINNGWMVRGDIWNAGGALAVADNFGAFSLSGGSINFSVVGTEE